MIDHTNKWINPLIALVILGIIGFAGYSYTTRNRVVEDELLTGVLTADQVASVDGDLLKTLGKLKKLHLDDAVFNDTVWLSLHDFGKVLTQEQKGRLNPFAPLSSQ
jgi:hypothetical protein